MILGGGSLQTKLSKKLRQDNSLCYTVNSSYNKYDNIIVVKTAVDINCVDKAIKLIKECLKDMAKDVSEDELSQAKELINTSLNMNKDDLFRIVDKDTNGEDAAKLLVENVRQRIAQANLPTRLKDLRLSIEQLS